MRFCRYRSKKGRGCSRGCICNPLKAWDSLAGLISYRIFLHRNQITCIIGIKILLVELVHCDHPRISIRARTFDWI